MSDSAAAKARQDTFRSLVFAGSSAATLACVLVYLFLGLVAPRSSLPALCYRLSFLAALGAHAFRASYTLLPKVKTLAGDSAALKRELFSSNAVLRSLYCAIFAFSARPTGLAWLPVAVHAAAQLGAFAVAKTRAGADPRVRAAYDRFQGFLPQLLQMATSAEVANMFVLGAALLTSRREVSKFMLLLQFLRAAWHCQDETIFKMRLPGSTSFYHRMTWGLVDERVRPLLRSAPAAQNAIDKAALWFRA